MGEFLKLLLWRARPWSCEMSLEGPSETVAGPESEHGAVVGPSRTLCNATAIVLLGRWDVVSTGGVGDCRLQVMSPSLDEFRCECDDLSELLFAATGVSTGIVRLRVGCHHDR